MWVVTTNDEHLLWIIKHKSNEEDDCGLFIRNGDGTW